MSVLEFEPVVKSSIEPNLESLRAKRVASSVMAFRRAEQEPDPYIRKAIYEHVYDQETTHICEILNGKVETEIPFEVRKGRLTAICEDGPVDWQEFSKNNFLYADLLAKSDSSLKPYLRIAEVEVEEALEQLEIVKAGEPKTTVRLSLCGDDIFSSNALKKIGRLPEKQRAMLRVSVFDGQNLRLYTRSIDGMSLESGKKFLKENFGIELPDRADSVDVLKARPTLDGAHHELADNLTPSQTGIDTYKFVINRPDLLKVYLKSLEDLARSDYDFETIVLHANELRNDIMASFSEAFEGKAILATAESIAGAGERARQEGKEFFGCDMVVTSMHEKTGLGIRQGEVDVDCVKCPKCSHLGMDKGSFRQGFWHCRGCGVKKAFNKNGQKVLNQKQKKDNLNQEGLYEWWTLVKQQDKMKRQQKMMQEKSRQQIEKEKLAHAA